PLTEAESLLRLAQQRLVLARDTAAAIDLFRAADELLRTIEDPAAFGVRETLAREVAALQALPIIDVPGIFARLGAQSERVAGFAVVAEATVQDFTVGSATRDATAESGWWNSVKQTLGEYF